MKKEKIAISLDKSMLEMVDSLIDNVSVTSRSQAISVLVQKALEKQYITDAVILLRADHLPFLFEEVEGKTFLDRQFEFLVNNGIETIYLVTGNHYKLESIKRIASAYPITFHLVMEKEQRGNVGALLLLQDTLHNNFVLLNGDTLNTFPLRKMIHFHLRNDKLVTIGLTISASDQNYNTVDLEGDQIVAYRPNEGGKSSVIDAGIYICNPLLFSSLDKKFRIFERDVLPSLCSEQHARGYFTYGQYRHFGE